jgi:predicted DNA-binding protein
MAEKDLSMVHFRTSPEQRKRLEHHARRLGVTMADLIRDGMMDRLEELDEKELRMLQVQRVRNGKDIPKKLKGSFRRYAEFIEEGLDRIDREQRRLTIIEDIDQRAASPEEARFVLEEFNLFLKARAEARGEKNGTSG